MQIYPIRFGINRCYLVRDDGVIMIDGGPPNKSIAFQKLIKKLPIHPNDIRLIILTHGDFDHVGSAPEIRLITGAKIAIHENDRLNFENSLYNWPPGTTSWGRLLRFVLNPILKISLKREMQYVDFPIPASPRMKISIGDDDIRPVNNSFVVTVDFVLKKSVK